MPRALLLIVVALVLASCGGDDEERATTTPETRTEEAEPTATETETEPATETEPRPEETEPELEPTETVEPPPETAPEEAPGGAGDEEPARSLALFTGEGGRIRPPVVRVPSFISIRIELRSADGAQYGLRFPGNTVRVSGGLSSASTTIGGLRPGAALVGKPLGAGSRVRIEATAEPGP